MDLIEFVTARYDEGEQLARHAAHIAREAGTRWVVGPARYVEDYEFVSIHTEPPNVIEVAGAGFDGTGGIHGLVYAEHIARHDPARVLADIAAKRAIVAEYRSHLEHREKYGDKETDYSWGARTKLEWICRVLAAPYAEHPDYDPAWAVG